GTYIVSEVLQTGWMQSAPKPVPPGTHVVNLYEGMSVTDRDFGNFKLGNISGYKWNDIDGDGVWGAGEPALEGWTIKLYKGSQLVATTTTNEHGYYEFTGLNPGQYTISEEPQAGWTQTYPSSGTHTVIITSGANIQNKSFGNFKNVEIRACKYEDKTGDGLTTDDTPLSGWTIKLYRNSQLIDTETTGSDGCYEWSDLGPGSYSIEEVVPQGWTNTSPTTHDFGTAQSGGSYEHKFTNFEFGRVSGYKWNDLDKDGVWGAGEPALNNWTIVLYRGSVAVASVVTDISGYYEFVGLSAGSYGVCEVLIEGWMQTYPGGVGCHNVTITSGMNLEDLNFGNKELLKFLKTFSDSGSLSGYVKPVIVDPITSDVSQIKTGPGIWWEITYFVENKDSEGHYYILWDKWGGNLMVLNSTPIAFNQSTKLLTLADGVSFKIDYSGYSAYLGTGLTLNPSKGTAIATLHKGDQQQGTNPGKGKGTTNDGKAYDVDIRWEIGWLNPGESATLKIYLAPGQNPGGQLQFSSWGTYVINTGPRVRAYLDLDGDGNPYENNEFQYSWDFTNQLTVNVYPK
ncbi:MAG: SdrD B-like domain-containing protein, partial [Sulfolobales archaeon]